jgi:hypothetical protein
MRACCGPAESTPATAQTYSATTGQAPVQTVVFLAPEARFSKAAVPTRVARAPRVEIRLLNSVFLI